jgi:hypothetical protein
VVDVEEGGLEIDADSVGDQEPPDPVLGRVFDAGRSRVPGRSEEVAQQADELRQRDRVDRTLFEACRRPEMAAGDLDLGDRVESVDVAREGLECGTDVRRCCVQPAAGEFELAELGFRPRVRLPFVGGCVGGQKQRLPGAVEIAEQPGRSRAILSMDRNASR